MTAWARLVLAALAPLLASGCALFNKDKSAEAAPPPPPPVRLQVEAPSADLRRLLETYLDLGRLGVLAAGEAVPEPELRRLIAAAPAQAKGLLETEGYFGAEVTAERLPGEPPTVRVRVQPGERTRVTDVRLEVKGPLAEDTKAQAPQALAGQRALRHGWGLPTGAPFRNRDWASAKNAGLGQLRAQGYAAPTWEKTEARIDAEAHTAALEAVAHSGPLFRTGELRIEGLALQSERVVRNLAGFAPGTPATEQLLLDYQERLQAANLYERVTVEISDDPANAAATPVTVRLTEQRLQQAVLGVGVSANVGPRVSVEHVHRRLLGRDLTARNKVEFARLRQAWEGDIATHPGPRFWRNLVGYSYERLESDLDTVTSIRLRAGRTKETRPVDRLIFVELERGLRRTETGVREQTDALSLNNHLVWRRLDSVLLPTDGYSVSLQGGVGQARSNVGPGGPFVRAYGRVTGYRPIGNNWFAMARVEAGQVFVRDDVVVPDSQRFRAGGDDSVRGYAYRTLAPTDATGALTSGNVLFTASAEIARPILASLPALWGAVFIDAGRAAQRWSDLKPAVGYGIGARYRSPIGPLRVDLAYGEEIRKLRLHLSVGVTF